MTTSYEKWPVEIIVQRITHSILNPDMDLYLVTGTMNKNQRDTLKGRMPILSEFTLAPDRLMISTVVSHQQLMKTYELFIQLAKEWRGQYYVITNKFVEACKPLLITEAN